MIEAAAAAGAGDRDALMLETLMAFKRAGATGVLTYHALDAARLIAGLMLDDCGPRSSGCARRLRPLEPDAEAARELGGTGARPCARLSRPGRDAPSEPALVRGLRQRLDPEFAEQGRDPAAVLDYVGECVDRPGLRDDLAALHGLYSRRRPVPFRARRLARRRVEQIFGLRFGQPGRGADRECLRRLAGERHRLSRRRRPGR